MFNHRSIAFALLFVGLNLLFGCQQEAPPGEAVEEKAVATAPAATASSAHPATATTGVVLSTLNAAGYTYVQVDVNGEQLWMAGPPTSLVRGATIPVNTDVPMHNFHSKALNRDFPVLYFVDSFTGKPATPPVMVKDGSFGDGTQQAVQTKVPVTASASTRPAGPALEGYDIAGIMANKQQLQSKLIKVRGKVTKFTGGIMRKNWIHMSDDSGDGDLIAITDQVVAAGQTVVIEGVVVLNRDFGYGYFYELLIEDSIVTIEN